MNDPKLLGVIRHVLTALGTLLVAFNLVPKEVVESLSGPILEIAGSVILIASFIASWKAKEKNIGKPE